MRNFISEFLGTSFLVMIVLGSGTMAQRLFLNHLGFALLANSIATGAGLFVLIQCLGPVSGAHMNPAVSLVEFLWKRLSGKYLVIYVTAQMTGAWLGVILVHGMFQLPLLQISDIDRSGANLFLSEIIATFGLISVVALAGKKHVAFAPLSVALYITSAYWFTSSTSFANPAVTFARLFTNTFGGMSPGNYFSFLFAQMIGTLMAWVVMETLKDSQN